MPVVIRKISPFCSLRLFSPTSLQRAKNACFSLIFPEKSAFWNGFELRRFDVKKSSFFDFFLRFAVESSSDNFRFLPANSVSCGIDDKTRNALGQETVAWVRLPPSAPKAAPCGVLPFIFATNYARARENPTVCAKYHYSILHWVVIFYCRFVKSPYFSYKHLPFIFK